MALDLRAFTTARVAVGRTGDSLPTAELLRFQLDHARARDAVHQNLDPRSLGVPHLLLKSQAPDRLAYLRRPDLGRRLSTESRKLLVAEVAGNSVTDPAGYDAAIVIADGLSALAVHRHAIPLLEALRPRSGAGNWTVAPLTVVLQGRLAIGDEIGQLLGARLVVVLIGERPGLTSSDSLGIYLTWDPLPGRSDAERNCISNVRPEGLGYSEAAHRLWFLMQEARTRKLTGVELKEDAKYFVSEVASEVKRDIVPKLL